MLLDILRDVVVETARLIPFLFVTYFIMEAIEEKAGKRSEELLRRAGKAGPLFGALAGAFPQCGFSAAAASLYSGGVISVGTLIAVFLSTSDEMLPIFISEAVPAGTIGKVLLAKVILGILGGFLANGLYRAMGKKQNSGRHIHDLCEQENCHCEEGSIFRSAVRHTIQITVFIFLVSLAAALLMAWAGEARVASLMAGRPVIGVFASALIGLVPNCAASVMITELYLKGILRAGQMMAGLLVGSGVGLLVLFRTDRNPREDLKITVLLYGLGVAFGLILQGLSIKF